MIILAPSESCSQWSEKKNGKQASKLEINVYHGDQREKFL